ncbi:MAG: hypothetical protein B6245_02630 [Desulfobacteraceae bacterium 4572_88]|nr:MAG: hypothetical protein B6245_02630 [Desulfobacteraceae bacterium 4572_88]RLC21600.1 MAG: prepilin-type cleavage/methylation domain-containing protein [Deltaproteobacteria bacterium]
MKTRNFIQNEEGFTLIEIIAVLVIMGILAAVAVPKFFDLQTRSREKAVYTAVSELKVRVNQHFASQLLNGRTVGQITYTAASVGTNLGEDFAIKDWVSAAGIITFKVTYPANEANPTDYARTIEKPMGD